MFKLKNNMGPKVFQNQFKSIQHKYPTKYSLQTSNNQKSKMTKCSITSRGPELWNNFIKNETKLITNISRFKKTQFLKRNYSLLKVLILKIDINVCSYNDIFSFFFLRLFKI